MKNDSPSRDHAPGIGSVASGQPETFELVVCGWNGRPAHCVYVNGFRLGGEKPWGGGDTTARWTFTLAELRRAFPDLTIESADAH